MLGALIGAGANIIGGLLGKSSAEKQASQNIAMQKEFAQKGIQWKVEDAKAAGLHPLAALGAQTSSFSPISVGGDPLAAGISSAGQDISRAVDATRSQSQRLDAYGKTVQDLNLRRMGLENELLASQIAKINQAGTPPPMPTAGDRYLVDGQAQSGLVKTNPLAINSTAPGSASSEAGAHAETGYARTPYGWAPTMSKDFQERAEDDIGAMIGWAIRNRLGGFPPPKSQVPINEPSEYWFFNPFRQEYVKRNRSKSRWFNGGFGKWDG